MNITITDQEQCKKEVRLELPSDVVRTELDKAAQEFARSIALPGFRPGRVPPSVVKSRFRKELRSEVVSRLLPDALQNAVTEKRLKVVGEPSLVEYNFGDDESLRATFSIETAPEFELASYKGIPLKKHVHKVTDEAVEEAIESLREEQAELIPVEDRGAQEGDQITANMIVRYLNEPTEGTTPAEESASTEGETAETDEAKAEDSAADEEIEEVQELTDQEIVLGTDDIGKQITAALAGSTVGEQREFTLEYPADYPYDKLAGRKVSYKVDITAIRMKEVPEADDQFAQSVDEKYNTMDELRAGLREDMEKSAEMESDKELRTAAARYLTDNNRFDVPEAAVEIGIHQGIRAFVGQFRSRGIPIDLRDEDIERMRTLMRPQAETDARMAFILDKIVEVEQVEVTDEEVDHEIGHLAEASRQSPEATKARLTKEGLLDRIKDQIKTRKALDLVIASAQIETEEVESINQENNSDTEESEEASE